VIRFFSYFAVTGLLGWLIGGLFGAPLLGLAIGLAAPVIYWVVLTGIMVVFMAMLTKLFR
jgi:hypothetical protein